MQRNGEGSGACIRDLVASESHAMSDGFSRTFGKKWITFWDLLLRSDGQTGTMRLTGVFAAFQKVDRFFRVPKHLSQYNVWYFRCSSGVINGSQGSCNLIHKTKCEELSIAIR
jgi:hypothetical protein